MLLICFAFIFCPSFEITDAAMKRDFLEVLHVGSKCLENTCEGIDF